MGRGGTGCCWWWRWGLKQLKLLHLGCEVLEPSRHSLYQSSPVAFVVSPARLHVVHCLELSWFRWVHVGQIVLLRLSVVKDPLATAQVSEFLIKFTGNNPEGKGSLVVNRQAKNPIIQTEFQAEVSKTESNRVWIMTVSL